MATKKKQSLIERLGINVMDAQDLQDKLTQLRVTLKEQSDKAFNDIEKEKEKLFAPIRKELDKYNSTIAKKEKEQSALWNKYEELKTEMEETKKKAYEMGSEISKVSQEKFNLMNTVTSSKDYIAYENSQQGIEQKYNSYVKLLENEIRKMISQRIREELVQIATGAQTKALENKQAE